MAFVHAYNIKTDIFVPVDFVDEMVSSPNDKLPLFVIHKFLCVAKTSAAPKFDFNKDQYALMLHNQINFSMLIPVIGS